MVVLDWRAAAVLYAGVPTEGLWCRCGGASLRHMWGSDLEQKKSSKSVRREINRDAHDENDHGSNDNHNHDHDDDDEDDDADDDEYADDDHSDVDDDDDEDADDDDDDDDDDDVDADAHADDAQVQMRTMVLQDDDMLTMLSVRSKAGAGSVIVGRWMSENTIAQAPEGSLALPFVAAVSF